ncbi:MAG: HAD-IIB family hydrolase [Nitrospira sp.]|nr:HAD-IIB family hydrolase [Nitrospira sp.]MCP9464617.1 HAD-IIB family hydrolase [Nitrospira sp.]
MQKTQYSSRSLVVFTDLDGTLLDSRTYRCDEAHEALEQLRARGIPVVLVSSKTWAEMEPIRDHLRNDHPCIVENGGALLIPIGYFPSLLSTTGGSGAYHIVEFGIPYVALRQALKEIAQETGLVLKGCGDLSVHEVAAQTGLSHAQAALAKQRQYDEPFIIEGSSAVSAALATAITNRGLRWTKGDRWHHLTGPHDKGHAVRYLIQCYRQAAADQGQHCTTVALGNSLNDLPMLAAVDIPVLVQQQDGSYEPSIDLPGLIRAPAPGPIGWNQALSSLLG